MLREILVSYDIIDNKIRKKVFNKLEDFGLQAIQKSVFWGYVITPEKKAIHKFMKEIVSDDDKFIITYVSLYKTRSSSYGYEKDSFKPPGNFEII